MELITKRTKSNNRFQKMRSIYIGCTNKIHSITGFRGQRNADYLSWGFNEQIINKRIMPFIYSYTNKGCYLGNLLIINDFTFELTNVLIALGAKNITVAFIVEDDTDKQNIKEWIDDYFNGLDQLNIKFIQEKEYHLPRFRKNGLPLMDKESGVQKCLVYKEWDLKELENMKIDLIIANPPYGAIGAIITDNIREKVDFIEYINLLPANDYKRNKTKDLFNYQSDMISIQDGFDEAAVTTHLAKISKTKINSLKVDEFERSQYLDRTLDKYFEENNKRKHYAIDASVYKPKLNNFEKQFDLKKCLFIGKRYINGEHLPYTKNCAGYKVNIERNISATELISISAKSEQANGNVGDFTLTQFKTILEQNNITNFLYSKNGYKFIAKILVSLNADSYIHVKKFLPKVDWTRSWTVEEILEDYGYTKTEIKEVMDDLNSVDNNGKPKYKGMDD